MTRMSTPISATRGIHCQSGDDHPKQTADHRQHDALTEEGSQHVPPTGANGYAKCHLTLPALGSDQQ
jgi:hypothetical protein